MSDEPLDDPAYGPPFELGNEEMRGVLVLSLDVRLDRIGGNRWDLPGLSPFTSCTGIRYRARFIWFLLYYSRFLLADFLFLGSCDEYFLASSGFVVNWYQGA